jgi:hypothetical protein
MEYDLPDVWYGCFGIKPTLPPLDDADDNDDNDDAPWTLESRQLWIEIVGFDPAELEWEDE